MNKKTLIMSFLAALLIVLASFTSAVCAVDLTDENKVKITTTVYKFISKEEIVTEVTDEEAVEIIDFLKNLHVALVEGDKSSIIKYESILSEKGILGKHNEIFSKKSVMGFSQAMFPRLSNPFVSKGRDIENSFCRVNAEGHGNLTFFGEAVVEYFIFVGAVLLLVGLIIVPLLPLALIFLFGGLAAWPVVHIVGHLVPFRIFNSWIGMKLVDGGCTISGRNGTQDLTAPLEVILRGFAGITINFPTGENPYLFVSGFSLFTTTKE